MIIPVYNTENYLWKAIGSIRSQTLDGIEIICVNDGSTDSSAEIHETYRSVYENFIVITQENTGAAGARNAGIAAESGEFLAFMDSDVWLPSPGNYARLYEAAKSHKVKICGSSALDAQL